MIATPAFLRAHCLIGGGLFVVRLAAHVLLIIVCMIIVCMMFVLVDLVYIMLYSGEYSPLYEK